MAPAASVYRAYDADGGLLYIGMTSRDVRRFKEHGQQSEWWADVASISVEHFSSREEAATVEANAVVSERPRHNIVIGQRRVGRWNPEEDAMTRRALGERLQSARHAAGFTQTAVAKELGISLGTLRNAESGRYMPKPKTAAGLAHLYGITLASLFSGLVAA